MTRSTKADDRKKRKAERQERLKAVIGENPFITDDELAEQLCVSIQTVRLDRVNLSIPEVRLRTKELAEVSQVATVRSIPQQDVIGNITGLHLGSHGESTLLTTPDMAFTDNGIVRGHHIFAQANSLAVALMDAERALTGAARVRYRRPVLVGQTMLAKAVVTYTTDTRIRVKVVTEVDGCEIFVGKFVIVAQDPTSK